MNRWLKLVVLCVCTLAWAQSSFAQGASVWFLAEGANTALFTEEIEIGNPSGNALDVTVTLLPAPDATAPITSKTFQLAATSRLTVSLASDFQLVGSSSARVSAVLQGTATPADIVVERSMYFPDASKPGGHNASGITQLAPTWTLAEGATTMFDTFVLVANPNLTATRVRATYLTAQGTEYTSELDAPANGRVTFWPRSEHTALESAEFSTFVESLVPGNDIVAERAMYFDNFRSGHDALGVASASTTWYFAEGFTGGSATTAFETFLLLANTSNTAASVTVDYLLDSGQVVTRTYPVPARSRFTVWVDDEGRSFDTRLADAAFGIRVTSTTPIVAERAMYWGTPSASDPKTPTFPWVEGHDTAGVTAPSPKWGFAEGQQGNFGTASTRYDTFVLLANPNAAPINVKATFMREDGLGAVREFCLAANARANIWTADISPLTNQRFSVFLETVANAPCGSNGGEAFVAERAMYVGSNFVAGHVNVGTPWTGAIVKPTDAPDYVPPPPPPPPSLTLTNVSPSAGRLAGGQVIQLTGSGFQNGARVYFINPSWTSDRNDNTVLPDVDEATNVVVGNNGTTITAKTPARSFYTGYQTTGPTTVRVVNPDNSAVTLANGFTFRFNVLAFGDDFVYGTADGGGLAGRPFPAQLQNLLSGVAQFGSYVSVTNGGVVGECATGGGSCPSRGDARIASALDNVSAQNAYDAVVLLEGVNDVRYGGGAGAARNGVRTMIVSARDRGIVPIVTAFSGFSTSLASSSSMTSLFNEIWALTAESLGLEIYRQALDGISSGGAYPTQGGYDRMASLVLSKVTREFPLRPCDGRNDKPGHGCPFAP